MFGDALGRRCARYVINLNFLVQHLDEVVRIGSRRQVARSR